MIGLLLAAGLGVALGLLGARLLVRWIEARESKPMSSAEIQSLRVKAIQFKRLH